MARVSGFGQTQQPVQGLFHQFEPHAPGGALDLTFGYVRGQVVEGYSGPDHRAPWSVRLELMEEALDRLLGLAET